MSAVHDVLRSSGWFTLASSIDTPTIRIRFDTDPTLCVHVKLEKVPPDVAARAALSTVIAAFAVDIGAQ
jgi:hypothetical protein